MRWWGVVEEVVVNVHHHPAMMLEYLSWAVDTERAGGGPTMQFWRSFHGQRHERPVVSSLRSLGSLVGAARSPDVSGNACRHRGTVADDPGRRLGGGSGRVGYGGGIGQPGQSP
jgi:hypothetical protein